MAAHQRTTTILVFVDGDTEVARWRLEMRRADLSTVDALARLALSARRRGWTAQLRQPSAALGELLALVGAVGTIYAPSLAIVDLTSGGELAPGQTPQVLLSAFWSATGLAAVVYGLARDDKRLRLSGLGLLGLAAAKVIVYDLNELDEIYRVLSFIALGLLLLAGAFAYQRIRKEGERP